MPHRRGRKSKAIFLCGIMGLFLWQAGTYPVLGQGSNNGALLPLNIAKEETKNISNVKNIKTYEIFVNKDTKSKDKSSESTPGAKDEDQKAGAQNNALQGNENQVPSRSLGSLVSKEDLELLTRVIYGEARGEDFEGQVAVGAVVLNRLKDPRFPKTMREIIYQSGAFTAVDDRQIHLNPDNEAYKAAEVALSGKDPTNGAIYYYNPRLATDRWIKSRPVIKRIGNHNFSI